MNKEIYIYSFYRFKTFKQIRNLKNKLDKVSIDKNIYGTLLIASEGINGTISGERKELDFFIDNLKKLLRIRKLSIKISKNKFIPFYRFKIRLKKEIVTIGNDLIKPEKLSGKYISPKNWDKIIKDKNYMIIDTRNDYEVNIGTFKNSINPNLKSFREFPQFIDSQNIKKDQKIAMFCTGGIRCEKASSYLLENGFTDICQLDGGILNYLDFLNNKKKSSWQGECFVFDNRVSLDYKLRKGKYDQCFGCRHPITEEDKKHSTYKKGVSCKYCINKRTQRQFKSSTVRQNQIDIAEKNKKDHPFKTRYS